MNNLLFHEIYGIYFAITKEILKRKQPLSAKELDQIVRAQGFEESVFQLLPSLQNKRNPWYLLKEKEPDLWLPINQNSPISIHTMLERRWLKTILTDSRISFFLNTNEVAEIDTQLKDISPLFDLSSITYYDQFQQVDSIVDVELQQQHSRKMIDAIQRQLPLKIEYQRHKKAPSKTGTFLPIKLEYSLKNNLFRLKAWRILRTSRFEVTLNLNRMLAVHVIEATKNYLKLPITSQRKQTTVDCLLVDQRQALKRSMLHFADYHKTTQRLENNRYKLTIHYDTIDETELLIRLLSFGPFLTVISPSSFVQKIKERVDAQAKLMENFKL